MQALLKEHLGREPTSLIFGYKQGYDLTEVNESIRSIRRTEFRWGTQWLLIVGNYCKDDWCQCGKSVPIECHVWRYMTPCASFIEDQWGSAAYAWSEVYVQDGTFEEDDADDE